MCKELLLELTQKQRNQLSFVVLHVRFIGEIRHQSLSAWFVIQSTAAARDFAVYNELAPGSIDYHSKEKSYSLGQHCGLLFDSSPERVLSCLTQVLGDGEPMRLKVWVVSELASQLIQTDLDVLSCEMRAIHKECPLGIEYHPISSGHM